MVKARRALLKSGFLIDDSRELFVSNRDRRQRGLGRVRRLGGHPCDWLPGIPNAISCQNWMLWHNIHTRSHPVARQVADVRQVLGRKHVHYTRQRADCHRVDFKYPRVGVGRTQHLDTQGPGGRDQVRNVTTAASQEAFVFETYYRTADADVIASRWTIRGQRTRLIHQSCLSDWRAREGFPLQIFPCCSGVCSDEASMVVWTVLVPF